jgi:hypothetical protein
LAWKRSPHRDRRRTQIQQRMQIELPSGLPVSIGSFGDARLPFAAKC